MSNDIYYSFSTGVVQNSCFEAVQKYHWETLGVYSIFK